jgi:hypothetical protein
MSERYMLATYVMPMNGPFRSDLWRCLVQVDRCRIRHDVLAVEAQVILVVDLDGVALGELARSEWIAVGVGRTRRGSHAGGEG